MLQPADIEDILQDAFSAAYQHSSKAEIRSPKAYLFTIARNLMSRKLAAESRRLIREIEDADISGIPCNDAPLDQQLDAQTQLRTFEQSVSKLPRQCRKVFLLRKIYGWPHKKIARKLGISTSTVERHITIALTRLDSSVKLAKNTHEANQPLHSDVKKPDEGKH